MENYSILIPSYTVGPKAYEKIYDYCHVYGKKAIVIGGARAMAAAKAKLVQALEGTGMTITGFLCFGKECTHEAARRLAEKPQVQEADILFAVGGGKAVDTVKLISLVLEKPYAAFPTIASNCAASSSVSIRSIMRMEASANSSISCGQRYIFLLTRISLHMRRSSTSGRGSAIPTPNIMRSAFPQRASSWSIFKRLA